MRLCSGEPVERIVWSVSNRLCVRGVIWCSSNADRYRALQPRMVILNRTKFFFMENKVAEEYRSTLSHRRDPKDDNNLELLVNHHRVQLVFQVQLMKLTFQNKTLHSSISSKYNKITLTQFHIIHETAKSKNKTHLSIFYWMSDIFTRKIK